ncbi:MAG: MYXO-CTERM sorting domain-containing protein, partial [bacterium]
GVPSDGSVQSDVAVNPTDGAVADGAAPQPDTGTGSPDGGTDPGAKDAGCSCRATAGDASPAIALLLLGFLLFRRRRR